MRLAMLWGLVGLFLLPACASDYKQATSGDLQDLRQRAQMTVERYRQGDPTLNRFFQNSAGYAVFPEVAKGAAGIGAAHGEGVVIQNGQLVGYTDLSQASIGLQLGGQTYSELIFFQNQDALERFKNGNFEFSAQASAVAVEAGAAANTDYEEGVAVFTAGETGLMFEASIGGQKFSYTPVEQIRSQQR